MSFWDTLKPAVRTPAVVAATASADQLLMSLQWDDGKSTRVSARTLRQFCPCAECVEEWSGNRTFDQDRIAADMKITGFTTVGNYAMSFIFSDTHRLGIYTWGTLRELSEARPA
jgi:DUF971 family protein